MEKVTVAELKRQLEELGLATSGNKSELFNRLKENEAISPDDSASQISSNKSNVSKTSVASSVKAARVLEVAKKAGLLAKAKKIKEMQLADTLILKKQQERENLAIEAEIEEVDARERVLSEYEYEISVHSQSIELNANALPYIPKVISNVKDELLQMPDLKQNISDPNVKFKFKDSPQIPPFMPNNSDFNVGYEGKDNLLETLVSYNLKGLMPKAQIETFDGDYLRYRSFIRAFDTLICNNLNSEEEKLLYLEQFTKGKPREIVSACLLMSPEQGYREARMLLDKRYGDPQQVTNAYINKILSWPNMKPSDVESLDQFAITLKSCQNAMCSINVSQREVEHPKTIKRILEKLPFNVQDRFRRVVYTVGENENREPCFKDLVEFVDKEARINMHPIYGKSPLQSNDNNNRQATKGNNNKVKCNTIKENQVNCMYCSKDHYLDQCNDFSNVKIDEKVSFIKKNNICFGCLKKGHSVKVCKRKRKCSTCSKYHPTLLHEQHEPVKPIKQEPDNVNKDVVHKVLAKRVGCDSVTKMSIVPVKVKAHDGNLVSTFAFIDPGSTASFCTLELFRKLKLTNVSRTSILLSTINNDSTNECYRVNGVTITDYHEKNIIKLPPIYTIKDIPVTEEEIIHKSDLDKWPHLANIDLPQCTAEIGLLLGNNVPQATEPWEVVHSTKEGEPYAVLTKLGWIVSGSLSLNKKFSLNKIKVEDIAIDEFLQNMYNREFSDLYSIEKGPSQEDILWLNKIEGKCVQDEEGHYVMPLPFRDESRPENNKVVAIKRTNSLVNKFKNDSNFYEQYKSFMNIMLNEGHAELVPINEVCNKDVWYMPHFGVFHPKKPNKLRIVFDCASKYKGISLNDKLLQGPDLTTPLIDVLLRFRLGAYAYAADLKQMFYQVKLCKPDRDYLRFLWWHNDNYTSQLKEFRMKVHPFGATSSPSCANYALQRLTHDHGDKYPKTISDTITSNFYVDDLLKSMDNENELLENAHDVKLMCSEGGFHLNKFISNSKGLLDSLPTDDVDIESKVSFKEHDGVHVEKTLGICWNVLTDTFSIEVTNKKQPITRRGILSTIGSIYDPLGLSSPFVLQGKLILQELCRLKFDWDQPIPDYLADKWGMWLKDLQNIKDISLNRYINHKNLQMPLFYELHHFADASNAGYAVVSYIRIIDSEGESCCNFLYGKCHVAPLKTITVPRLELTAATLMVKANNMIINAFKKISFRNTFYWTDSQSVIKYIKNEDSRFLIFVANRVALIRNHSNIDDWKYVPSMQNPADDGSRGAQTDRWLNGPEFLSKDSSEWPQQEIDLTLEKDDREVKICAALTKTMGKHPIDALIEYHSTFYKLKKSVAWLLRVRDKLRNIEVASLARLTRDEIKRAHDVIIKYVQQTSYPKEYAKLVKGEDIEKSSTLIKLNPIIYDDMMRVGGRLLFAPVEFDEKYPLVLPHKHRLTQLVIMDLHEKVGHSGREHTLSKCREKYWVTKGSSAVRSVISNCYRCKKLQAPPMQQIMADIPVERFSENEPPFTNVGLDFFGPFYTKCQRSQVKRYGVLFTCLTCRAVHIEIAYSLDTSSFINSLRRFIARRGPVKYIRCDQGTNLVGAQKELAHAIKNLDHDVVGESMLKKEIQWQFNTPSASNMGGIWERQIRTVRKVLNAIMTEHILTDESLITLMCEVENIINSRPITTVSTDVKDLNPLTPNHLLNLKGYSDPIGKFTEFDKYSKRWRHIQHLSDVFWKRWHKEYLRSLQERRKWQKIKDELKVGDIVLIIDETSPRCYWPLGRIIEVFKSADNMVRSVEVQTKSSKLKRPINKLVLLIST